MAKTQLTFRIDEAYFEKVKFIAEKEMRSTNGQIEYFVAKAIDEYEKENGTIQLPAE